MAMLSPTVRSAADRYLDADQSARLFQRIVTMATNGDTFVRVQSRWSGTTRWVRNRISASTDRVDQKVTITRILRGAQGTTATNQFDDESLASAIRIAERQTLRQRDNPDLDYVSNRRGNDSARLFVDATAQLLAAERSAVAQALVAPTIAQQMVAAGFLEAAVETMGVYDTSGVASHAIMTNAQYSVTVRTPDGKSSGWAGIDHVDWTRVNATMLSERALDKCVRSINPVSLEPGRYGAILEPQAVHAFVRTALAETLMTRLDNERYEDMPYNLRRASATANGIAKFGMQVMDERITIDTDPADPDAGYLPFTSDGTPYPKSTWIEHGVLRQLPYDLSFALEIFGSREARPYTPAYRMSGGTATIEDMIAATRRGILVTRFLNVVRLHRRSVLSTGVTADGVWLIEQGKISKPIRNFRFNASPLHAFNQVETLGAPQRVFSPGAPALVPPVQLTEFHFSHIADSV